MVSNKEKEASMRGTIESPKIFAQCCYCDKVEETTAELEVDATPEELPWIQDAVFHHPTSGEAIEEGDTVLGVCPDCTGKEVIQEVNYGERV